MNKQAVISTMDQIQAALRDVFEENGYVVDIDLNLKARKINCKSIGEKKPSEEEASGFIKTAFSRVGLNV